MGLPHLHLGSRNAPLSRPKIKFGPLGPSQFAGPYKDKLGKTQGTFDRQISAVGVNGPKQLPYALFIRDGCHVLHRHLR